MSTEPIVSEQAELEPGRRPDIEHELTEQYHVDWRYVSGVKPTQFDQDKSLHNQARFEPIDQPTVDLYTEAVKRGDHFPAVLAYRPGPRQRYVIIDGNHRLAAHIAAGVVVDIYEIDRDTHPHTIALLTFASNTHHGKPTSESERVHQAIWLIDSGASINNAAAAVSIGVAALKRAIGRAQADQRADDANLKRNEWDALTASVKTRLLNISTDEGFGAAAVLAYQAQLSMIEVAELVAQMNANKSASKQLALVKALRELHQHRIQAGGGGVLNTAHRRTMGPKQRVNMAVAQALALPEDYASIVKSYARPERADASKRMREAGERLTHLADLLDK